MAAQSGTKASAVEIHHSALAEFAYKHHAAVLVVKNRRHPELVFESMPAASAIGFSFLYHGLFGHRGVLDSKQVERKHDPGRKYDSPINVLHRIRNFVRAYRVDCDDLLEPDLSRYATLNDFFYRKLREGARPIADPADPLVVSSAADCRLTVFPTIDVARKHWIKGRHFTLGELLSDEKLAKRFEHGSIAIFRLAPADYHRYHSPVDATVGATRHFQGKYYTVNSLIVRDPRFDPLGENKRDITLLSHSRAEGPDSLVAFVQVGALLVSSIRQTVRESVRVKRGDELGYFAYGGSTIVCAFEEPIDWDQDLLRNSMGQNAQLKMPLETMVRMGERIGKWRRT
ncbi:uncharacterized protein JCM15063_000299 [Sporobolomyces koalae]|uniref:uncharacterized protein n=1 Tax=Sporobolomyces koalae TaxID=500713 RepID=UPI003175BED6